MDSWLPFLSLYFMLASFAVARVLWPIALKYPHNRLIDWMATIATLNGVAFLLAKLGDLTNTPQFVDIGYAVGFGGVGILLFLIAPLGARIGRTQKVAKKLNESDERLPADMLEGLAKGKVYDTKEIPPRGVL
jgi:hypothetical protein